MKDEMRYQAPVADVIQFGKDEVETNDPYFISGVQGISEGTGKTEYSDGTITEAGDDEEPD